MNKSGLGKRFYEEPAGVFAQGELLQCVPDMSHAVEDPDNGYWHCSINHDDRLTWSEKVYDLFGLPKGAPIERDWATAHYNERSREALERVRGIGLEQKVGFLLDAKITPEGANERWIRVLAVPIIAGNEVVGLHGLKRAL